MKTRPYIYAFLVTHSPTQVSVYCKKANKVHCGKVDKIAPGKFLATRPNHLTRLFVAERGFIVDESSAARRACAWSVGGAVDSFRDVTDRQEWLKNFLTQEP